MVVVSEDGAAGDAQLPVRNVQVPVDAGQPLLFFLRRQRTAGDDANDERIVLDQRQREHLPLAHRFLRLRRSFVHRLACHLARRDDEAGGLVVDVEILSNGQSRRSRLLRWLRRGDRACLVVDWLHSGVEV
jgi:hypothetical protein